MNTQLDVEISGMERLDQAVWASARDTLRERRYGDVTVAAEWPAGEIGETVRLPLRIAAEQRDAITFAELFVHDLFLIFNIASPGSFGGTVGIQGGGELLLDERVFEYVRARVGTVPLAGVAAWYDSLNLGANEAGTPIAKALFHLLHLARAPEDELLSVVRLAEAAAALGITRQKVFDLLYGEIPVVHPVAENDDVSLQWIDAADLAAKAVVEAIQEQVRIRAPLTDL